MHFVALTVQLQDEIARRLQYEERAAKAECELSDKAVDLQHAQESLTKAEDLASAAQKKVGLFMLAFLGIKISI